MLSLYRDFEGWKWFLCGVGFVIAFLAGFFLHRLQSPALIILLNAGLVIGLVILTQPIYGLYAVLIQLFVIGDSADVTLFEIGAFALLIVVVGQAMMTLRGAAELWQHERMWLTPLLIFLGWCILNLGPAMLQEVPLKSWLREFFPLLNYGLLVAAYVRIRNRQAFNTLVAIVVGAVFLVTVRDFLYTVRLAFGIPLLSHLYGLLVNLLGTRGGILFALLPVMIGLAFLHQGRHLLKWLISAVLILIGGAVIVLGGTRTAWMGMLVALALWGFLRLREQEKSGIPPLVSFWVVVAVLVFLLLIDVGQIFGYESLQRVPLTRGVSLVDRLSMMDPEAVMRDWSFIGRVNEVRAALSEVSLSPILGRGLGYRFTSFAHPWEKGTITRGYLHNAFVWVLLKLGIVGLINLAWFMVALGVRLWQIRGYFERWDSQVLPTVLLVILVVMNLVSLTTPYVNDTSSVLILSLLIGGAFGATRGHWECQNQPKKSGEYEAK
jgi:hypothetical protein